MLMTLKKRLPRRAPLLGLMLAGLMTVAPAWMATGAQAAETVRIGQAATSLSFLPLYAARSLDSFKQAGMDLKLVTITGGDPNALAALDSGDIDLAAVGSDTVLNAVSKGQPFQIVYSLMSSVTIELVVSNDFMARAGVTPSSPLKDRIAALRGATVGVSAIGGAQDRMLKWLAAQGGLDPKTDVKVAQVGPPPALQAALENHRIDAFVLSPPQGFIASDAKYGTVLISLGNEMPQLKEVPYLVLVAKTPVDDKTKKLITDTAKVLNSASTALTADSAGLSDKIQAGFFHEAKPEAIRNAVDVMKSGITGHGELTQTGIDRLLDLSAKSGATLPSEVKEGSFWTNEYLTPRAN